MFFLLSKVLDLAFAPLTWVLSLLAAILVVTTRVLRQTDGNDGAQRLAKKVRWQSGVALLVLCVASCQKTSNAAVRGLERSAQNTEQPTIVYDAVILLGGLIEERATYSSRKTWANHDLSMNQNAERLTVVFELLRGNRAKNVVISGGSYDHARFQQSEADLLAERLKLWGIDDARILVEGASLNTRENALYTRKIVDERKFEKLLLVTSAFHMSRSIGCFRAVGLFPDTRPVDFRSHDDAESGNNWLPRTQYLDDTTWALREWFGRGVYRARGYSK
jgi:uncharacterized SAM-binding protein YcdF (DUF218 family)